MVTPDFSDTIKPLGRIFVKVRCNNPSCKEQFEVNSEEGM